MDNVPPGPTGSREDAVAMLAHAARERSAIAIQMTWVYWILVALLVLLFASYLALWIAGLIELYAFLPFFVALTFVLGVLDWQRKLVRIAVREQEAILALVQQGAGTAPVAQPYGHS